MKYLQEKYALSKQGAGDLFKGILYSALAYISLMLPVALLACVLNAFLAPLAGQEQENVSAALYTVVGIVILALIFILHYRQYTVTYMGTYEESERRRITLVEKLRTLPLRFFHERDLSDLTSTIMSDCAGFEHAFSHTVAQFWGSILSTALVCITLLICDWRMGLALLWVAPVSFAIVLLSRKLQVKLGKKHIDAKLALADGVQECLETVQDIKACNLEKEYLRKLDAKIDAAEKAQISSETATASLVTAGQMFLRLGLATVIVVGHSLMLNGQTTLFSYILFLIAASRLYDPLSGAMTNMAELFNVDLQVDRLKAIQNYPEENGRKEFNRNFKVLHACARLDLSEEEFLVFLGKLHRDRIPYHANPSQICRGGVLAKVIFVLIEDALLHSAHFLIVFVLRKILNDFRHSADIVVILQPEDIFTAAIGHQRVVLRGDYVRKRAFAHRFQELAETHGMQVNCVNLANGVGHAFVNRYTKQRTSSDHRIFRRVFAEVF